MIFSNTFQNSSVLLTGHTGFKGSWLAVWLKLLGANITGISLEPPSNPSHFEVAKVSELLEDYRLDIRKSDSLKNLMIEKQPDFVFHLAAQPLVRQSYINPIETYSTNVIGTLNLLEGLREIKKKCTVVIITSDKCYDNVEWIWGYRENDKLGGTDPYSASKGAAELLIRSHVKSFFPKHGLVRIAVGRAGNVIGGGDWAKDRIVSDCVLSWANEDTVKLRNPMATRPWQHVLEPLSGYLTLACELEKNPNLVGEPFNFGPPSNQNHSVKELVSEMSKHWENVRWEELSESEENPYESGLLKLNCDKALHLLNWEPVLSFKETVRITADWYSSYYKKPNIISEITLSNIKEYQLLAKNKGLRWAN